MCQKGGRAEGSLMDQEENSIERDGWGGEGM